MSQQVHLHNHLHHNHHAHLRHHPGHNNHNCDDQAGKVIELLTANSALLSDHEARERFESNIFGVIESGEK